MPLIEHCDAVVDFVVEGVVDGVVLGVVLAVVFRVVVGAAGVVVGAAGVVVAALFLWTLVVQEAPDFVVVVVLSVIGTKDEQKADAWSAISTALQDETLSRATRSRWMWAADASGETMAVTRTKLSERYMMESSGLRCGSKNPEGLQEVDCQGIHIRALSRHTILHHPGRVLD